MVFHDFLGHFFNGWTHDIVSSCMRTWTLHVCAFFFCVFSLLISSCARRFIDICRYLLFPPPTSKIDTPETNTPSKGLLSLSTGTTTPSQAPESAKSKPDVPVPFDQFCDFFLARLLVLARDPVSNVRLTLARLISDHLKADGMCVIVFFFFSLLRVPVSFMNYSVVVAWSMV